MSPRKAAIPGSGGRLAAARRDGFAGDLQAAACMLEPFAARAATQDL